MFQATSEAATQKRHIDFHLFGLQTEQWCNGVAAVLRHLRGGPDFTLAPAEVRNTISWLHGSMRHERQLIGALNLSALGARNIAGRKEFHRLSLVGVAQRFKNLR